jgi:predicted small metal-binding protein
MTKQLQLLSCREVGCYDYCDYIVTGETEQDVMRSAAEHNMKIHGKTKTDIVEMRDYKISFL